MKTIILKGDEEKSRQNEVWLHLDKIQQIKCHNYAVYTETTISCTDGFLIHMDDYTKQLNFKDLINRFAQSDQCIKTLKVADLEIKKDYAFMRAVDWVSQAMKG